MTLKKFWLLIKILWNKALGRENLFECGYCSKFIVEKDFERHVEWHRSFGHEILK